MIIGFTQRAGLPIGHLLLARRNTSHLIRTVEPTWPRKICYFSRLRIAIATSPVRKLVSLLLILSQIWNVVSLLAVA
jgi:hypothetical protein